MSEKRFEQYVPMYAAKYLADGWNVSNVTDKNIRLALQHICSRKPPSTVYPKIRDAVHEMMKNPDVSARYSENISENGMRDGE